MHQSFQKLLRSAFLIALLAICLPFSAHAAPPPMTMSIDADNPAFTQSGGSGGSDGPLGFMTGISKSGTMLGNMWGFRPFIGQYGMTLNVQETSEDLGNVSGGLHKGFEYDGLTQIDLQLDTQRAFGLYGGTFNLSALDIHGDNLSANNLGTLQTASGIEADRGPRLWEAWYQQKFLDQDRLDVKIGQQSLDQEFMVSNNANYFVNTMMGWAMVPSADLPGGGPAYPLSDIGIRVRARPVDGWTLMAGVFNGDPMGNNNNPDSQRADKYGTNFPLDNGALIIGELQYSYPALGAMVSADDKHSLSGTYKLGFWYDTEKFADQEFTDTGLTQAADPTGNPLMHKGDYSVYAVADQMVWHSENVDDRTLNFFTRVMAAPQSDRNLINLSANAGLTLHEPIFGRDDDTFGVGVGYAHVGSRAANLDADLTAGGTYTPVQTSETFVEATYQYQVTPWWQLQPDAQYVFKPDAGALNPDTNQEIKNEAVVGIRTNILF